jgi:hypothetical protein
MPAKDLFHDVVLQALTRDGWRIVREQVSFIIAQRQVIIDIQATRGGDSGVILVEVKGFGRSKSMIEELASATGRYLLYRLVMDEAGAEEVPFYLAVPDEVYAGILSEPIGILMRKRVNMKLCVFDPTRKEIVAWIN